MTTTAAPARRTVHKPVDAMAWTVDAACAGQYELYDTAAALPDLASTARVRVHDKALAAARTICHTCPALRACDVASWGQDDGFWAGMTELERDTRWHAAGTPPGRPGHPDHIEARA